MYTHGPIVHAWKLLQDGQAAVDAVATLALEDHAVAAGGAAGAHACGAHACECAEEEEGGVSGDESLSEEADQWLPGRVQVGMHATVPGHPCDEW